MTSVYTDPSTWRQATAGGIPYRVKEWSGSADSYTKSVTGVYLVQSSYVRAFIDEMVPRPVFDMGVPTYKNATLPNNFTLRAIKASWKSHNPDLPADAYGTDTSAPADTYYDVAEVAVEYNNELMEPNSDDPWTYCDFRASVAGEYIYIDSGNTAWESPGASGPKKNVPATIIVPEVEWSVEMPMVPLNYFSSNLKVKLDLAIGKVNSSIFTALLDSPVNCVLFVGYEFEENGSETFADGLDDSSLRVTLKFLEKKIAKGSKISDGFYNHQYFYNSESGSWQQLFVNGLPIYTGFDFNRIFSGTDVDDLL